MERIHRRTKQNHLLDPDNHDGVIGHVESDILKCKVKWALGSITMNKASRAYKIPVELFQMLRVVLLKCCTQYASKFGKLISGHRTEKRVFILISEKVNAKCSNYHTVALISHDSKVMLKILHPSFNST